MLKTIGLLGGTSWPSTIEYYRTLNEFAQETLGGFHSANLLLRSIDYHDIKSRYYDRWSEIPSLLEQEIKAFVGLRPDCLVICNNTLHKAFDVIEGGLALPIPVFHIVKATAGPPDPRTCGVYSCWGQSTRWRTAFTTEGLSNSASGSNAARRRPRKDSTHPVSVGERHHNG